MRFVARINRFFETMIDPYRRSGDLRPPAQTWRFLWHYVRQTRGAFVALLILGGLVALVEAALFYFIGRLVDMLNSVDQSLGWAGLIEAFGTELAMMLVVVLLVRFLVTWAGAALDEQTIVPGFYSLVRWQAYSHVARQSLSFFNNEFAGSVMTKVWQSGSAVGDFMITLLEAVWFMVVYTLATLVLVAYLDWRLAVLVAVWVALFAVLARRYVPRVRALSAATAEASSAATGRIVDSFANMQTLKLFGSANQDDAYVRQGMDNFLDAITRLGRTVSAVRAWMAMLSGVMIVAIGALSIHLWSEGLITVGGIALAMGLVLRLYTLLGRMMNQLNGLMRNFGTAQNSAELISRPLGLVDVPDAKPLVVTKAGIRFEHVVFHYGRGSGVLDDFTLTVPPGQRLGIVGRSGAGKSTLVSLLLRFYDVEGGRILIDGQDIAKVTQESLRANIGVVTQDTGLLNRSLRANITYGRPEASDFEMRAAAENAEANRFIEDMVDQRGRTAYDAHVGERGVKLSGGQRQRVAIARVLLKNAPILVLDEATSALDSEVEAAIQSQLTRLMEGKTVLAIAHRLSTIAAMDRLVVMDKGKIVEDGTHAELLARGGHYARLWSRQSGGFLIADPAETRSDAAAE